MKARRTLRPVITLALIAVGAFAGGSLCIDYISYLEQLDTSLKSQPDSRTILGIPVTAGELLFWQKAMLYACFVVLGMMLALVIGPRLYERLAHLRRRVEEMPAQDIWAAVIGLVIGLLITALIVAILQTPAWLSAAFGLLLCYLGISAMLSMKEELRFYFPGQATETVKPQVPTLKPKLLDTNVIIDGRIADVCKAGFLEGQIYIPRFVLEELQQIADSSDSLKRARGRRGLDILNQMRKEPTIDLKTHDAQDVEVAGEVDALLVRLAQQLDALIVTNDFNLNKIAELQGVKVLNVNELANALKPVVLPGEDIRVLIIKEGKESNQGIGYLDDGTMIVVEGGRHAIGETMDVVVTSVLQTVAGKMIFAHIKSEHETEEETIDHSIRSYSSGRQRRKIR